MGTLDTYVGKVAEQPLQREINSDNGVEFITGAYSYACLHLLSILHTCRRRVKGSN